MNNYQHLTVARDDDMFLTLPAAAVEAISKESGHQNCHLIEANRHTFQSVLYSSDSGLYLGVISMHQTRGGTLPLKCRMRDDDT